MPGGSNHSHVESSEDFYSSLSNLKRFSKNYFSHNKVSGSKGYCIENFIKAKEVPVKAFPDYKRQFTANGGFSQLLLLLPAKIMMVMVVRRLR